MTKLGDYLNGIRERHPRLSMRQMSIEADVAENTVSRIISAGSGADPDTIRKLADAWGEPGDYEKLMELAGHGHLLRKIPDITDGHIRELVERLESLPAHERQAAITIAHRVADTIGLLGDELRQELEQELGAQIAARLADERRAEVEALVAELERVRATNTVTVDAGNVDDDAGQYEITREERELLCQAFGVETIQQVDEIMMTKVPDLSLGDTHEIVRRLSPRARELWIRHILRLAQESYSSDSRSRANAATAPA